MKLIIAGSRTVTNLSHNFISEQVGIMGHPHRNRITEVVCGMARGADMLGWQWAKHLEIPIKEFPADWEKYGKYAGFRRNEQMATYADELIAFWDGKSNGTRHMIECMIKLRKPFQVILVR